MARPASEVPSEMSAPAVALLERIQTRTARAGVVGLGYVGLPLAVELGRAGLTVTGISVVTALLLVALAIFAGIAAAYGHPLVLALFFLASFFPVGVFLLPTDHWLRFVGWADLGLLVAAVLIWATARRVSLSAEHS